MKIRMKIGRNVKDAALSLRRFLKKKQDLANRKLFVSAGQSTAGKN